MATYPKPPSSEVQAVLDEIVREHGGTLNTVFQMPIFLTDLEWEEQLIEDERFYEEIMREAIAWRTENPDAPLIVASDLIDEDRGPR